MGDGGRLARCAGCRMLVDVVQTLCAPSTSAQGDGGRMDDETLAELQRLSDEATVGPWEVVAFDSGHSKYDMNISIATVAMGDHICGMDALARYDNERDAKDDGWTDAQLIVAARNALPSLLRELGDTRARLAAVETEATRLRDHAEAFLYDGDHDVALPGYVEVYGVADALAALGATDQAGGGR